MKLTFLGAAHEVTGSCTLLQACGKNILIDCGMEQGADIYENQELPIAPGEVDAVLLTHAHIDHSGMLPALVAKGYAGSIHATGATVRLCNIMLLDSAHIQESEAEWRNRKAKRAGGQLYEPVYTTAHAQKTLRQMVPHGYDQEFELFSGVKVSFGDAGHLLGSSSIYLSVTDNGKTETIVFSGDLGNINRPLIRDPKPARPCDYAVIESTYGDRLHGERPDYVAQLTRILQDTFDRGGNLVVPCFAVGRTQEMLYLINQIRTQRLLPGHEDFLVYVDSPLAVEATKIYSCGLLDYYDQETLDMLEQGIDPISFPGLRLSITSEESKLINEDHSPKVILSASGMCEAGRIRHHLKHNLWRSDSTVLFVGYQSPGTLGGSLVGGAKEIKLFGEEILVNCKIENLQGISGHADRDMLLSWLRAMGAPPRRVFVNHGQDEVCDTFAKEIEDTLGYPSVAPYSGDQYDTATDRFTVTPEIRRIQKKEKHPQNPTYDKLFSAASQLFELVKSMRGRSNRELEKLTSAIKTLINKHQ